MSNPNTQRRFLPSIAVLRSFECAARHESFTQAAEELHLTQSAISRQVKEFEDVIGVDLFRRVGRRVTLTRAGHDLASELAIDLDCFHQTIMKAISAGNSNAAIRVAVLPTFASRWLIPRLSEFTALHPNIEISFSTRLEPFDMNRQHFDLAIHFGKRNWPGTNMDLLCSETMIAVASPAFQKRHNIRSITDLAAAPLLHVESRPMAWDRFFKLAGAIENPDLSGQYFDQFSLLISGAIAGLGAALIPTYLVERDLLAGHLVTLDETTITTKNNYYLVTPENAQNEQVSLFTNWMKSNVSQK